MARRQAGDELVRLAALARGGDDAALERLLAAAHVYVVRFYRAWLFQSRGDWEETALDLAQDTLVRIGQRLGGCRAVDDLEFLGWCRSVALSIGLEHLGARRSEWDALALRCELGRDRQEGGDGSGSGSPTPGELALARVLEDAHAAEPDAGQVLLWHRLVRGDEWEEVGAALGIAATAAKRRFQRAQTRLRVAVLARIEALGPAERSAVYSALRGRGVAPPG